jgi:hypothetical protein
MRQGSRRDQHEPAGKGDPEGVDDGTEEHDGVEMLPKPGVDG